MFRTLTTRLSIAAVLTVAASGANAANVALDVGNAANGMMDIYSATFDGALVACGGSATTYCTFFGGDPGATRKISTTPNPSGVINGVPGGIGPTGIPVAPVPAAGSFLDLTRNGGNTQVTLGVSSIAFPAVDFCLTTTTPCDGFNIHAVGAGMVLNATGPAVTPNPALPFSPSNGGSTGATVPIDANGRAVFMVQNGGAIVADFSRFSQVVTSCFGGDPPVSGAGFCALITGDVLNLDVVRYVLEIDYDPGFTSFTASFVGETSNNSIIRVCLLSGTVASPDVDCDGVADSLDNCPVTSNMNQLDSDLDTIGNACDTDDDADTVLDGLDNCPVTSNAAQTNSDADARGDVCDNCSLVSNLNQLDSNSDGYGNICDADLNNSNLTTSTDFNLLRSVLNQSAAVSALAAAADMNGSGLVTSTDFNLLRARLNSAPGASGLSCAGTIPCPSPLP